MLAEACICSNLYYFAAFKRKFAYLVDLCLDTLNMDDTLFLPEKQKDKKEKRKKRTKEMKTKEKKKTFSCLIFPTSYFLKRIDYEETFFDLRSLTVIYVNIFQFFSPVF